MRASRHALLSILLGMTVALGMTTRGASQETDRQRTLEVIAENRTNFQVRVYALQDGHMVPVGGLVPAKGIVALWLPPMFAESGEPVQLVADLLGSEAWYKSEPLTVNGPDPIEFIIEDTTVVGMLLANRGSPELTDALTM